MRAGQNYQFQKFCMISNYFQKIFSIDTQKAQAKNWKFWKMYHLCVITWNFVDLRMCIRYTRKFNMASSRRAQRSNLNLETQSLATFVHFLHIFWPTKIGRRPGKPAGLPKIKYNGWLGPVNVLSEGKFFCLSLSPF